MPHHDLQRRRTISALACMLAGLPLLGHTRTRKLKVTAIYTVPFEQQWVSRVHLALNNAKQRGQIDYKALESISAQHYAKELRSQANAGADVIFGEVFEVEDAARLVAKEFPSTAFVMGSSGKPQAPNFSVFDNYIHEPAYLAGMLAGGMSKSGHIGMLGGFAIPEVNRLMNAFMAGAKEINPKATFMTGEIRSWLNQARARSMTMQMATAGVDAIFAATMAGVLETTAELNILTFGNIVHPQSVFPRTLVASALWNLDPTVQAVLQALNSKTYHASDYSPWSYMGRGGSSLSPLGTFTNKVPPELLLKVRAKERDILSGKFVVPVKDDIVLTMK